MGISKGGGHAWDGGGYVYPLDMDLGRMSGKRKVHILLECFLVWKMVSPLNISVLFLI